MFDILFKIWLGIIFFGLGVPLFEIIKRIISIELKIRKLPEDKKEIAKKLFKRSTEDTKEKNEETGVKQYISFTYTDTIK